MSEFVDFLHEVFADFGRIDARRMFGGWGIYHDNLMFALVYDEVLYLKADPETAASFEGLGSSRFEYSKDGQIVRLSYYSAPAEIFDDPEQARTWATRAYAAALRTKKTR